jgi:hypothetical protein
MPLIVAYIGGKNVNGSTLKPKRFKFTPKSAATASGMIIESATIIFYTSFLVLTYSSNKIFISSFSSVIWSEKPLLSNAL